MAGHVVQALRTLADGGMTIIITIHQPSSQVYGLFHKYWIVRLNLKFSLILNFIHFFTRFHFRSDWRSLRWLWMNFTTKKSESIALSTKVLCCPSKLVLSTKAYFPTNDEIYSRNVSNINCWTYHSLVLKLFQFLTFPRRACSIYYLIFMQIYPKYTSF